MPKRSLQPGGGDQKKIEQLSKALDATLARDDGRVSKAAEEIGPLVRIAAELRNLPSASFKARLKSELGGKKSMSTVAEPVSAVRVTAIPRLAFREPAKAIEFYQRALGAKEKFRFQVGDSIPHAELTIGDSSINVTGEWPEGGRFSAETLGHSPVWMSIQVADVDGFTKHAVAEGMKLVREPKDQFYGHRDAMLEDPFGYTWSVFTVTEEMPVEEMHRRMQGLTHGPEGGEAAGKKGVSPVPRGFRTVTPYLVAADGLALLDFVHKAFDAEEIMRAVMPTGVHGEMRIGDTTLMMGGGLPGKKFPGTLQPGALHVYVEDADAVTAKAVSAGAILIDELRDQEYGERSSTVRDPHGNFWYIATHRGKSHIPEGLQSVNPYLHPRRAEPVISFLRRAFGAQEVAKYSSPDGVIQHAVVRVGDAVLEMGEAHGKYEPMPAMFYLYVPNMDAVYRQALAAGATSFQEPTDQPYGDRNAGVQDAFGNKWYIATHIKDVRF
ncbi:MAG TPA: VOC family protein [Candidatus Sulfotelmatobacter sp.]|nr:VOC family protein [Candidatus Sulfotelmatobacter sp.]